ncbi:MAG: helix-turn-helix domain-containing protein [Candidatus Rokubacteria bacterium]|nr:helix-turn-helix domain-containing protein [Candidatus Rokubacteria bacterium]
MTSRWLMIHGLDIVTGKELRGLRGTWTQVAFAARLGVHANTLARYERDELPIPEPVARLAKLLGKRRPSRQKG